MKRRSYSGMRYPGSKRKRTKSVAGYTPRVRLAHAMAGKRRRLLNQRTAGLLGVEVKYFDTTYTNAMSQTLAGAEAETATYGLFCPQQGDSATTRDGNKVMIKKIMLRGAVLKSVGSDAADMRQGSSVMIAVVLDKQTNGTQLSAEDVFDDTVAANAEEAFAFRKISTSPRFEILARRMLALSDTTAGTDGANTNSIGGGVRNFEIMINKPIMINFSANAGAIGDLSANSIHVIGVCSTGSDMILHYNSRVRFVG